MGIHTTLDTTTLARDLLKLSQKASHGTDMVDMAMEVMVATGAANAVKQTLTLLQNQKLSHITTMVTIHTTLDTIISARDLLKLSQKLSLVTFMVTIHTTPDTTTSARDLLKLSQKLSHIMVVIMVDIVGTTEARDLLMPKLSHIITVMDIIHTLDITGVRYAEATMH